MSFGYMISFKDGHYYTIIDDLECLHEFIAHVDKGGILNDRNITDYFDGEYSFTLWPAEPVCTIMEIYQKYGICNGLTISKLGSNHIELYWFAKGKTEDNWHEFFIRNKRILLEFTHYFDFHKKLLLIPSISTSESLFKFNKGFDFNITQPENKQELDNIKKLLGIMHSHSLSLEAFRLKANLSPREVKILSIICRGFSTKFIAKKLEISVNTVNTHIAHIKQKTGLRFKMDLIEFYEDYFYKTIK